MQDSLERGKLPTVIVGTRQNTDEPPIFENELQTLSQDTRDKLSKLEKIQVNIEKLNVEERQIKEKVIQYTAACQQEHGGPLPERLVTLDEKYNELAGLELELMDIRKKKNIIAYEKSVKIASTETLSTETIDSIRKDLGERKDELSAAFKSAQPVTKDINHLKHKLETAEKLAEATQDKYATCLKEKSMQKELHKLEYAINLAKQKLEELKKNVRDEEEDDQRKTTDRRSFQESLPLSKEIGTTRAELKGLMASQPGERISIGHPNASNTKLPPNNGNHGSDDYSFLFKFSRWGGEGYAYHGHPSRKGNNDSRRPGRGGHSGGPSGGFDPNNDSNDEDDYPNGDGSSV